MKAFIQRLHVKLGDFWWYSILMFAALRCGDLINAVVGLWLVPKYVPQEELGAVLPLTQFATTFGLPISILVVVFTKYLAQFRAKGELGKVKSLLRWFLGFVMVASLLTIVIAKFTLPALFERIRIQDGSLSLLIIATGIIGTVAPVFNNALQGLKKFKTITFLNLVSAPIRLVSMLILLPIRALSGYMAGQLIPSIVAIITSTLSIRKDIDRSIVSVPFWKGPTGVEMLRFLILATVSTTASALFALIQTTVIRQRLPEIESAAYYMITRFAELGTYAGLTLAFMMFPLASEDHVNRKEDAKVLYNMTAGTVAFGGVVVLVLHCFGTRILSLIPMTRPYSMYATDMTLLTVMLVLQYVWGNYSSYELAHSRFAYNWYGIPLTLLNALFIACFSGYAFFYGIFPNGVVEWMGRCHIATLRNIIWVGIAFNLLKIVCALCQHLTYRFAKKNSLPAKP